MNKKILLPLIATAAILSSSTATAQYNGYNNGYGPWNNNRSNNWMPWNNNNNSNGWGNGNYQGNGYGNGWGDGSGRGSGSGQGSGSGSGSFNMNFKGNANTDWRGDGNFDNRYNGQGYQYFNGNMDNNNGYYGNSGYRNQPRYYPHPAMPMMRHPAVSPKVEAPAAKAEVEKK